MPEIDINALLGEMRRLALEAGRVILEVYDSEFAVTHKDDKSPVTEADQRAEEVIEAGLRAIAPETAIIAEEAVSRGEMPGKTERFFLVDPLDGTKSFINREGEFTVNIALVENGVPLAGVVLAPATGRLFFGADGRAYEQDVDHDRLRVVGAEAQISAPRPIEARRPKGGELVGVVSRSHATDQNETYLAAYGITRMLSSSSSLKFCLVAAGEADIYPRHGTTMEWDTAAGHAILLAAGGRVEELDGKPLRYGKFESDLKNPHFVARGRPA